MTKTTSQEEEYFARESVEKLRKLHAEEESKKTKSEKEAARKLHEGHCPKCGAHLTEVGFKDVMIDRCFSCGGVFLDAGELEHLAGEEGGYLKSLVSFIVK
ncbi:MAG: zf-TFIIB domain-containing protein [Deltaproteobacteria bacterium]|nr:zf-TFIIB domain-containing protein [Deltaproteobacteria bacterium]